MRICHISTVHYSYDTRIFFKYIKSSISSGLRVDYITPSNKKEIKKINGLNFYYLTLKTGFLGRIKRNIEAYKLAKKSNSKIIHFHDPELIFVGVLLKIFRKKIIIYDIHELYHDSIMHKDNINLILRFLVSKFYVLIEIVNKKQGSI